MKRIIDIPDEMYDDIKHGYICSEYADTLIQLIPNSKPYEEQPQGKWIYHEEWENEGGCGYECPRCGRTYDYDMNFCGYCGLRMKGKDTPIETVTNEKEVEDYPINQEENCKIVREFLRDIANIKDLPLYKVGIFQLTELRRWLIAQGYSEGTVDDKINEFTGFVERIRGEE